MNNTNTIKHAFRKYDIVESATCTCGQTFTVENITEKRVVCRQIDTTGRGYHLSTSNHVPGKLTLVKRSLSSNFDTAIAGVKEFARKTGQHAWLVPVLNGYTLSARKPAPTDLPPDTVALYLDASGEIMDKVEAALG